MQNPDFVLLEKEQTGIHFSNTLRQSLDVNLFNYMYFYNGGGLGAGDFNQDGRIDLFFTSNQGDNQLYLNEGNLRFKDVTQAAQIPQDNGWSTGVSVVDINQDGLLDIYVSQVGDFNTIKSRNQLLICEKIGADNIPVFSEQAEKYNLDLVGFSTQAAFFDYDLDGDLDLFQLNHSLHANGTFGKRNAFEGKIHPLSGDRFYKNENGQFVDHTQEVGINSTVIGYGLGIAIGDTNLDGYPDIYIGNDFHENDYLYINQKDGTFKEVLTEQMMHTSRFSMGVDIADLNNDAHPEIFTLDMLPYDPYILKKSEGEDAFDIFRFKLGHGYNHQYAKNSLQLNNGDETFSEVAMYAGIYATDWSWAPLLADFDNDGHKDVFVSNGIPKRMNDIDYINFLSSTDMQDKITFNLEESDLTLIEKLPEVKLPNKFFRNSGQLLFDDLEENIQNNKGSYSNGAIYADLDNDGDLDIVTNNINETAFVYENKIGNKTDDHLYLQIELEGPASNKNAIGAKVLVRKEEALLWYEKYPTRGFQSSMEVPLHIGLGKGVVSSITLIWPDNTFEEIQAPQNSRYLKVAYKSGLPKFDYSQLTQQKNALKGKDITAATAINFTHKENPFVEFNREPLMPHMTSSEGPALAVGDVNGDGLNDLFIGAAKRKKPKLFIQKIDGTFFKSEQTILDQDSIYEDVDAVFADINNDNFPDLLIASGGNEYYRKSEYRLPRAYLNDGKGQFEKVADAFGDHYITAACILPFDFTGDGHLDLFIGARTMPWAYGATPISYLFKNDGTGKFTLVTDDYCPELAHAGMVKQGILCDLDQDQDLDIILAIEWGGIDAYINNGKGFDKKALTDKKGWWNFVQAFDYDRDGDVDLIAGNLGLNSRLKTSAEQSIKMYYDDFDQNKKAEQILTYYLANKEIPFANKMELQKQMPGLKKKYLYAEPFAKAKLTEIFPKEKLKKASLYEANYFENSILINEGDLNFKTQALPFEAQFTSFKTALPIDANGDEWPDIFIAGNYYDNNVQMGRLDADYGTILLNDAGKGFKIEAINDLSIKGQVRRMQKIKIGNKTAIAIARNDDTLMIVELSK